MRRQQRGNQKKTKGLLEDIKGAIRGYKGGNYKISKE